MAMVVQHNLTAMNSNRMLGITTGQQSKSSERLSSGYKINRAADDAAGLTISEKMRKQIRGLDRASTNAQDGISAVQTAEGALTEVHSMLQRMNELAVQSANGTNSADDRKAIQDEINQLVTEIDRVSETTKFNEIYLLKGEEGTEKEVTTTTYSYDLTDSAKADQSVKLGLVAGANPVYGAEQADAVKGEAAAAGASMALATGTGEVLDGKVLVVKKTTDGIASYTEIGANDIGTYFDVDDQGQVSIKSTYATGYDFATAATAADATAGTNGGATALADAKTAIKGTPKTEAATSDIDKYVEVAEDGTLKYKEGMLLYTAAASTTTDEYGDQTAVQNGNTAVAEADLGDYFEDTSNPLVDKDGKKITDVSTFFVNGQYQGGIFRKATAAQAGGNAGNNNTAIAVDDLVEIGADQIKDFVNVNSKSVTSKTADALEFNLHVGSESPDDNKIKVTIKQMSAAGIGVDVLKDDGMLTEEQATDAIDTIASAIKIVSEQRSALGAIQNRLEHTIANLDNVVENTTSAESRIRDTDMAKEMVEYSKNNILAQAGQSMLAQANQSTQGVLSLLG